MRRIIKCNQIVLTALAIMLAVVGYLNFTKNEDKAVINDNLHNTAQKTDETGGDTETANESKEDETNKTDTNNMDTTVSDNETIKADATDDTDDNKKADATDDAIKTVDAEDKGKVGEVVLVNSVISTDAIFDAKLSREQQRAKNKADLLKIVEDSISTQEMKDKALNQIISITENSEKELAAETLLEAKGYNNVIVSVVDSGADVVVDIDTITTKDATDIMDVVKRKTGVSASNIVISPVTSSKVDIPE